MAQVSRHAQVVRKGVHTQVEIKKTLRPAFARDDLKKAFAGEENSGPAGVPKERASGRVKSRKR